MKLWAKIFILVLILFVVAFYSGIYLMSGLSYKTSLEIARDQAFVEYEFIASRFSTDLEAIMNRQLEDDSRAIHSLMTHYINYYKTQNVDLTMLHNGETAAGNLFAIREYDVLKTPDRERISVIATEGLSKFIFVSGKITDEYVIIYSRDITLIENAQKQLTVKLMISQFVITVIFIVILYLIVNGLTKPVRNLQSVTQRITEGDLDARAEIKGNDEITTLAVCFNNMAQEVQSKILEHKKISTQKQQFIDNLAHELKTPLTTIYGYAELLQKTKASEEDLIEASFHIMEDVKRIQDMSKKLLDLALTRDLIIEWEPVLLKELFEKMHREFSLQLKDKDIELITNSSAPMIRGESVLIESLFVNLLDNAIKASLVGGKIYLSSYDYADMVVVEIRDEGIGIRNEHLDSIFEPFYMTDFSRTSSNKDYNGTGLGLALCKQIADAHHAEINIESETRNGTTIKIYFNK